MVYKKYIYRDGKKFGPYYFKSIRTKEGKVKSVYLGKEKPANNFRVLPFLIVVLFLFSFLGLFSYSGFSTVDLFSQNSTEIQVEGVSENISVEDGEINITEIINNTEVNSSLNETTRINMTINNTKLNSSLNETIDINLTETEGGDIINYSKIIDDDNSSFKFEEKSGSAPILQSSRIDPTNPDSTSTLYGFCNATDSESDRLTYCYEWYNDEIFNQSECEGAPGFCYQESSNVSTVCGGLDTGTYSCDDNWWSAIGYGCDKAYDGDWDTNGFSQMGVTANMYINYTKPFGAVIDNSFWQVKDAGMGGNAINLTIPLECWEYEILQFNVRSSLSSNLAEWYCLNDTGWGLLREFTSSGVIFDESMIWNFSDHATGEEINLTFLASSFLSKGQNWTFNCMANDGTSNASSWLNTSVLIGSIPPIMQSSRIDPIDPNSTSTLYGFCNATDSESDRLTYCYEWYNDDVFNQSECEGAPGFCYQESSNVSTVCGGLETGTYSCDDNWWSAIGSGCDKVYDGDFGTNGFSQLGVTANMYINYTRPFGAVKDNSFWQVKDAGMGGNAINLTIPLECWEYEILQFNVRSSLSSNLAEWYCLNDTGWELMREYASSGAVWEEAMIWNFSDHAPGEEINLTFLANGFISKGQNWTFNCMANDGTINASNWLNTSVLIAGIPPIVQSSRIDPINPTSSNDLIGYCNATGADNDLLLYYYEWYNDGVLNQTGNTLNYSIIEDDTEDAWNSTGTFAKAASRAVDENWGTGNQVNSMGVEGITFINYTKPNNLEGAKIEYKYSNGAGCDAMNTLDCYTGSTWTNIDNWTGEVSSTIETSTLPTTCYDDEDTIQIKLYQKCSDSVTLTSSNFAEEKMWWNISGESYVEEGIETEVNNLDSEYVSKGQNWTFNCMAFDSIYNASSWINTSVLIGNSPPIMQTARINPASPYTSDNLEGFCNATDIDGDNVTYYFEWYNETEFHSSGKSYTCYPSHNDNLDGTCTVTLRPNAVGNMPEFSDYPSAGDSYLKVDDSLVDEDSTYVYKKNIGGSQSAQIALRENSVTTYFTKAAIATYSTFSSVRTTRPSDNSDWTISDIDSLQIGAREAVSDTTDLYNLPASNIPVGSTIDQVETYFRARIFTDKFGDPNMRVTQVYAEATYSPSADYFEEGVETNIYDLSSDNTAKYQNWTFNCTAFDGDDNSSYWENDSVTIFNTAPYTVSLTDPENNSTITNRIPSLQWNEPNDADSDSLTYHLLVDNNLDFSSPIINLSPPGEGISELYHVPSSDLSLDTLYYWKVRAYDGDEFGPFSNVWNFTVESLVEISLTTDGINFGTKGLGEKNDTTDDNPYPFVLQNDGNCLINVSLNATDLFSGTPTGGMDNYQFKVDNVSVEPGSFNWGQSVTEWYGLPPAGKLPVAISDLKYEHATDSAQIEIDFTIPEDELPGNKNSTITLIAEIIE